jgi:hypothetical protein
MVRWFVKGVGGHSRGVPTWEGRIAWDDAHPTYYRYYQGWPEDKETCVARSLRTSLEEQLSHGWWQEINPADDEDWLDEGI